MAFKFPLATVLRVRILREEREERLLQQILFEIRKIMLGVAALDAEIERVSSARTHHLFRTMNAHELHGSYGEIHRLREQRRELSDQLAMLEDLKDKQLAAYDQARRDRRMLTEMRERQHSQYLFQAAKEEQRSIDEFFSALRRRNAL